MESGAGRWIVCQVGAREHYAIATELHRRGTLDGLLADVWAAPGSPWKLVSRVSKVLGAESTAQAISGRYRSGGIHGVSPGIARWARWQMREARQGRDQCFSSWAASEIEKQMRSAATQRVNRSAGSIIFSYSYAAADIGRVAKRLGATFVLGQIDGGRKEMELVRAIGRKYGLPVEAEWRDAHYWARWREECDLADLIIVNSNWSRSLLQQEDIDVSKCRIVPLAYEPSSAVAPKNYPEVFTTARPLRVLFLGQLTARKGVMELLAAMDELRAAPIMLRLVGPPQAGIERHLTGRPNVKWDGICPRSRVRDHYRWADVFVLPTHSDGFAITQLEAQEYGLPLITSPFCGHVVEDRLTGLRLETVTARDIAGALLWAQCSPVGLRRMSEEALRSVQRYSPRAVVDQLCDAVASLGTPLKPRELSRAPSLI